MASDPENLDLLKHTIGRLLSFDCSQYSDSFLSRRIEIRLRALGIEEYSEYQKRLFSDAAEPARLARELTIHVTNFFRDKSVWEMLLSKAIPELMKTQAEDTIRVWSAGCSTGEEPLSAAITFFEALGPDLLGYRLRIRATDREEATIAEAKKALYEEACFREVPESLRDRYFEREGSLFRPREDIRNSITYESADIFKSNGTCDLILCRNTVIYFSQPAKEALYLAFHSSLRPGGILVIGKTETLVGPAQNLFRVFDLRERIYFK